ncbi:chromosome partitioning protein ParA, partial [Flavobacteriaceae bacterium]|nr:chromosome partitioning protein ParA [Flavobacteriaceae bacterium]
MESNTTPNNRLKIILVITLVLLFGTGFYTLNLYNSNIETQEQLIAEKELVLKDLNNMAAQYDIAIDNNDVANNKLIQARERIEGLMDSL